MTKEIHHPIFARLYARLSSKADARGVAEHRRETLADLRVRVTVVDAVADRLPFPDARFDAAVPSLLLCTSSVSRAAVTS